MTALYLTELLVIAAALAAVPWMKRAGERRWRAHNRVRMRMLRLAKALEAQQIVLGAALMPAMARAVQAAKEMAETMSKVQAAIDSTRGGNR